MDLKLQRVVLSDEPLEVGGSPEREDDVSFIDLDLTYLQSIAQRDVNIVITMYSTASVYILSTIYSK